SAGQIESDIYSSDDVCRPSIDGRFSLVMECKDGRTGCSEASQVPHDHSHLARGVFVCIVKSDKRVEDDQAALLCEIEQTGISKQGRFLLAPCTPRVEEPGPAAHN